MDLSFIKENKLMAVVRGSNPEKVVKLGQALYEGGVKIIEITAETPKVMKLIEIVKEELSGKMYIGVGTVLDPETARNAILAGADFVVSPTLNLETIKMTKRYGKISIPGAMTPTEILTAYEAGADAVKVFPSGVLGPNFLKDIKGPLPHIPLVATGGIDKTNIANYVKAGAVGIGLGGALVDKKAIKEDDYQLITENAKEFVNIISK